MNDRLNNQYFSKLLSEGYSIKQINEKFKGIEEVENLTFEEFYNIVLNYIEKSNLYINLGHIESKDFEMTADDKVSYNYEFRFEYKTSFLRDIYIWNYDHFTIADPANLEFSTLNEIFDFLKKESDNFKSSLEEKTPAGKTAAAAIKTIFTGIGTYSRSYDTTSIDTTIIDATIEAMTAEEEKDPKKEFNKFVEKKMKGARKYVKY